jgi:hypothetical protein
MWSRFPPTTSPSTHSTQHTCSTYNGRSEAHLSELVLILCTTFCAVVRHKEDSPPKLPQIGDGLDCTLNCLMATPQRPITVKQEHFERIYTGKRKYASAERGYDCGRRYDHRAITNKLFHILVALKSLHFAFNFHTFFFLFRSK